VPRAGVPQVAGVPHLPTRHCSLRGTHRSRALPRHAMAAAAAQAAKAAQAARETRRLAVAAAERQAAREARRVAESRAEAARLQAAQRKAAAAAEAAAAAAAFSQVGSSSAAARKAVSAKAASPKAAPPDAAPPKAASPRVASPKGASGASPQGASPQGASPQGVAAPKGTAARKCSTTPPRRKRPRAEEGGSGDRTQGSTQGTDGAWEPAWGEPSRRRLDADAETTRGDGEPNTNPDTHPDPDCEHGHNPKLDPHPNRNLKPNPNPNLNSKPNPKPSLNPQPTQTLILTPTLTLTLTRWRSAQRAATPGAGRLLARRLRVWAEVTARRAREPRWLDLLWSEVLGRECTVRVRGGRLGERKCHTHGARVDRPLGELRENPLFFDWSRTLERHTCRDVPARARCGRAAGAR